MTRKFPIAGLIIAALGVGCPARAGDEEKTKTRTFEESYELILNPDRGWIAYNYEDSYDLRKRVAGGVEPFALASVVYTRHPRNAWEDAEGNFENSPPLKLLKDWIDHRRHVSFRIYVNTMGHLPPSLRAKVQAIPHTEGGKKTPLVKYWDPAYVEDHRRLVEFLGKRLGDSPHLAFVDIGAVGNTGGEWYFGPLRVFQRAGLDDEKLFELVETFVEMYRKAFPKTRLFISYECIAKAGKKREDVLALLARHHIGIRDDGLGGWPYPKKRPPTSSWPMPTLWEKMPVLFEGSGGRGGVYGWHARGKDPQRILDWAFQKSPPSYVNIGGSETVCEKACSELRELLVKYGRRLGYRFVMLTAEYPQRLQRGQKSQVKIIWTNRGIAPCYADRKIELSFHDGKGKRMTALAVPPEPPTTEWRPGKFVHVRVPFTVPDALAEGEYVLKLAMLLGDPRQPREAVTLANKGADPDGRYALGTALLTD